MILSNEFLLTLISLKGFGPATVKAIASHIKDSSVPQLPLLEFYCLLEDMLHNDLLGTTAKKNFPSKEAFQKVNSTAIRILEESDLAGIKMISQYDPLFPKNLLKTVDETGNDAAPLYLFYKGKLSITEKKAVAIIGTREPSPEGVIAGEYIAAAFAKNDFNIVSGLAIGCDAAGHRGALSVPEGKTTAFLANGLDTVYPPENKHLAEDIVANGGLLLSEYPIGTEIKRYNLVARDRLQAGLADATIVIQTGINGGTMHAVNATLKAGKPLYVVDYSKPILLDKIQGNKFLKENNAAQGISATNLQEVINTLMVNQAPPCPLPPPIDDNQGNDPIQLEFKFD